MWVLTVNRRKQNYIIKSKKIHRRWNSSGDFRKFRTPYCDPLTSPLILILFFNNYKQNLKKIFAIFTSPKTTWRPQKNRITDQTQLITTASLMSLLMRPSLLSFKPPDPIISLRTGDTLPPISSIIFSFSSYGGGGGAGRSFGFNAPRPERQITSAFKGRNLAV